MEDIKTQKEVTPINQVINWTTENSFDVEGQDGTKYIAVDFEEMKPMFANWLKSEQRQMTDIPEDEEVVVLKGTLKTKESSGGKYCLILSTPAMDIELTRGSFMHCSDIQSEITALA